MKRRKNFFFRRFIFAERRFGRERISIGWRGMVLRLSKWVLEFGLFDKKCYLCSVEACCFGLRGGFMCVTMCLCDEMGR